FTYKLEREQSLMWASTNKLKQLELIKNAKSCSDEMFKTQKGCIYKTDKDCLVCDATKILFEGSCIDNCPDGFYQEKQQCKPCHTTCSKCTSSENGSCSSCVEPFVLDDKTCKEVCPLNKFPINRECKDCTN